MAIDYLKAAIDIFNKLYLIFVILDDFSSG